MLPFSALFDFVTHHHHRRDADAVVDEMDPSSLSLDSSSSSSSDSNSTVALEPIHKPLSDQVIAERDDKSSSTNSIKRKVDFYHSARVQFVEGVDDYSEEEKKSTWYTRQEFDDLKKDRRATVKVMEGGNPTVDDGHHYFRGVESKTRKGSQRKQWNVVEAAMVVFDEQQMSHIACRDPDDASDAIANAYREAVTHSQAAAIERGLFDQRAALESTTVGLSSESLTTKVPRRLSCRAA